MQSNIGMHPSTIVPWLLIRANNICVGHLNLTRDLLVSLAFCGKKASRLIPDPNIAFEFEHATLKQEIDCTRRLNAVIFIEILEPELTQH
ncbi:MAG: hypothetical protein NMNS01_04570 [Nitrosomonas sp.]|nr:MAG: hypothetical protein NMNS01_04570 [Nitrosomonas sp.]